MSLAATVRKYGRVPTTEQKLALVEQRATLQGKIDVFERQRATFFRGALAAHPEILARIPVLQGDVGEEWDDVEEMPPLLAVRATPANGNTRLPEQIALTMPSTLGREKCVELGVQDLCDVELKLREGQANDILHHIRIAVGQKSFLFRGKKKHNVKSQQTKTRAWAEVSKLDGNLRGHARVYTQTRKAMVALGGGEALLTRFRALMQTDLKVNASVAEPNARGQSKEKLAWFFKMDQTKDIKDSNWMQECKCPEPTTC